MQRHCETEQSRKAYARAEDVARVVGCCQSKAGRYIRQLNKELSDQGFLIAKGRVPWKYLEERFGGLVDFQGGIKL